MHATRRVQTLFAQDKVHYEGEKVAAIAATTKELAEEAADLIEVEYEPLQGSGHVLDSIKESMPVINEGTELLDAPGDNPWGVTKLNNVAGEHHSVEGDVEAGFAESDRIYTHTFYIPRAHQTYIEPQVTVADVDVGGKVTVWTSTQGPFGVRSNLANSLRLPTNKINVHGMTIGGGFGAKFGGIVDTYAVLLAQKARRPVKMVYSRHEEFVDGRPAPGAHIHDQDRCQARRHDCRAPGVGAVGYRRWSGWWLCHDANQGCLQCRAFQVRRLRREHLQTRAGGLPGAGRSASDVCRRDAVEYHRR